MTTTRRAILATALAALAFLAGPAGAQSPGQQLIEMSPRSPHAHGNYGNFLKRQKRYDEAIEYYGKAIAIRPYPQAEENLKQTLLLRDAARK